MSKTSSFLSSAFDKALAVVSIVGIGAVVAVFDDARAMIEAHAVPAALICIASGTLGYAIGCLISNRQTKSAIAEMNRSHSEELRALESERESLARDISELRKEHEAELDTEHESRVHEISELRKEHEAELNSERESHKREISELRAENGEKLEAERKNHEAEVASLNESHAAQIAAMQADFESRLEAMRAEYDASAKEAAAAQRKSAKLDKIQRRLSVLSASQKELVAKALDEGTVHAPSFGCDAAYLRDLGVFVTGSMGGMLSGADYSVNPEMVTEIREHREWLG